MAKAISPTKKRTLLYSHISEGVEKRWIFYQRLENEYTPLYKKVINNLDNTKNKWSFSNASLSGEALMQLSERELEKEKQLLSYIFDIDVTTLSFLNEDEKKGNNAFYKNFNRAMNMKFLLEDFFKRNALLIKSTSGQKNLLSFYDSYFIKAWEEGDLNILKDNIFKNLDITNGNIDMSIKMAMDTYLPDIVEKSLNKWLAEAGLESGIKRKGKGLENAYVELLNIIRKVGFDRNNNPLINAIYKEYGLENIELSIKENINSIINDTINKDEINKAVSEIVTTSNNKIRGSRAGNIFEHSMDLVLDEIGKKMKQGQGFTFKNFNTGSLGNQSADHTIYFNVNTGSKAVKDIMNNWNNKKGQKTVREHNIDQIRQLQKKVSARANKKGFVVYISDKNYALGKKFSEEYGGFSAKAQSLINFEKAMVKLEQNFSYAVSSILQCIPGAIGSKTLVNQDYWSTEIAKYIAYMLFDDFDTIGEDMTKDGGINYIHLMNLNGVILPLSLILKLLAEAISNQQDEKDFVTVNLEPPSSILYTDNEAWHNDDMSTDLIAFQNAWETQREDALQNFNIRINFLKSIKQIITEYI